MLEKHEVDAHGVGPFEPGRSLTEKEEKAKDGGIPAPAPTLSRTPAGTSTPSGEFELLLAGADTRAVLDEAGLGKEEAESLLLKGVVSTSDVKSRL